MTGKAVVASVGKQMIYLRLSCSRISTVVSAVLLLTLFSQPVRAESGQVLFQRALLKERAEGDLEEASRLYRRIVQESSPNRALVARALVQIGKILEKQGSPEARSAYELVAWDYADQQQQAAMARLRLALMGTLVPALVADLSQSGSCREGSIRSWRLCVGRIRCAH